MSRPTTKGFFVKERLAEARDARGLSQSAVALMVGRSASTVSKWESGDQAPEPGALDSLSKCLSVSTTYLTKPVPQRDETSIFFRSLASASGRARTRARGRVHWLQHLSLSLQSIVDLPAVNIPGIDKADFRNLRENDLENIASQLRLFWHLGEGPISCMALVCENAGVVIGIDSAGSTRIDGQSSWSSVDDRPYILLNNDKFTAFRRQMDLAHELAHLVLHRSVSSDDLVSNFDLIEAQAKYFACAMLLPYKTFPSDIFSLSLDGLLKIKARWKVSIGAMVMRAHQLELLSDESATRLWKARASRGWHKREPLDDPLETPVEIPRILRRSIELIIDNKARSKSDLLNQDIGLPAADVELLASLPTSYFDEESAKILAFQPRLRAKSSVASSGGRVVPFRGIL